MNVTLKKGDGTGGGNKLKPGEWGRDEDGIVFVRCVHEEHTDKRPRIGVIHRGVPDPKYWNIDAEGKVTPSIFFKDSECGWHVFAKLEGWTPA